jgi:hypothetical protein
MVMQNGGIAAEKQYPYRAKKGTCQVSTLTSFSMLDLGAASIGAMLHNSSWSDYIGQ